MSPTQPSPPRLWFHLQDVLPLAEHAMACYDWQLINRSDNASPHLEPALLWQQRNGQHEVSSNGDPMWCGTDGLPHTVTARMWQPAGTPESGPDLPRDTIGVWPLGPNHHDSSRKPRPLHLLGRRHRDSLIARLRAGAAQGRHWLSVAAEYGGGPHHFHVTCRGELAPAATRWEHGHVTSPEVRFGQYPALIAHGGSALGAGDVVARFDRATVKRMCTHLEQIHAADRRGQTAEIGQVAALRVQREIVHVLWSYHTTAGQRWVEIDRVHPDSDGYYAVGAYLWPWQRLSVHAYSGRERW